MNSHVRVFDQGRWKFAEVIKEETNGIIAKTYTIKRANGGYYTEPIEKFFYAMDISKITDVDLNEIKLIEE